MWTLVGLTVLGGFLNRLRGSRFFGYIDSGVGARFAWAIPTAILLWYGTTPQLEFSEHWTRVILLVLSCWAMWLLGSGAHSVHNFKHWKEQWDLGHLPDDTEAYSDWILKKLYGGTPDPTWTEDRFLSFHMTGKAFEGVLRMMIMVAPICILAPWASVALVISGSLWGMLFNLGWAASDDDGWAYGEILCGAITYLTIGLCFYIM